MPFSLFVSLDALFAGFVLTLIWCAWRFGFVWIYFAYGTMWLCWLVVVCFVTFIIVCSGLLVSLLWLCVSGVL